MIDVHQKILLLIFIFIVIYIFLFVKSKGKKVTYELKVKVIWLTLQTFTVFTLGQILFDNSVSIYSWDVVSAIVIAVLLLFIDLTHQLSELASKED